jgi:hypothetical protein
MANNVIYVQKRGNRYWVWLGDGDEEEHTPAKCDARFYYKIDARNYAEEWRKRAYVNEICELNEL